MSYVESELKLISEQNFLIKPNNSATSIKKKIELDETINDIISGTCQWRLWCYLALAGIRRRYHRTILGPLWTTLSMGIFIFLTSLVFSFLWKMEISGFLPYFTAGYIAWTFISTILNESSTTFISVEGVLKQLPIPYTAFAWLNVSRNLLLFFHHIILYVLVALIFQVKVSVSLVLLVPALLLTALTGVWVSMCLGLICARFRDLQQLIANLLQISIFITPVFWRPEQLSGIRSVMFIEYNPLHHYVDLIRAPLTGHFPEIKSWVTAVSCTLIGWLFTVFIFSFKRKRLIFWL